MITRSNTRGTRTLTMSNGTGAAYLPPDQVPTETETVSTPPYCDDPRALAVQALRDLIAELRGVFR